MKKCTNCGMTVADEAEFCVICGSRVENIVFPAENTDEVSARTAESSVYNAVGGVDNIVKEGYANPAIPAVPVKEGKARKKGQVEFGIKGFVFCLVIILILALLLGAVSGLLYLQVNGVIDLSSLT